MSRSHLFVAMTLAAVAVPVHAELNASLDHTIVSPGDTVQLTLARDGRTQTQPDLRPLAPDFDILGRSSSSSVQIVNGATSASTQLQLTLSPKHTGRLSIPSLMWDSDHSAPLTLEVASSAGSPSTTRSVDADTTGNDRVFIETEVSPRQPYVQAAVNVTVRIYSAVPLSDANLDFSDTDAALVRQSGPDDSATQNRNGKTFDVITRHYVLFPQHSGEVNIPGATLSGEVPAAPRAKAAPDDLFSNFFSDSPFSGLLAAKKPIRLHAAAIKLDVRPRPAGANASVWLPAKSVSLEGSWKPLRARVAAGDPITLDLDLKAHVLTAAQLPDLAAQLQLPPGIKAYPDPPELKDTTEGEELVGERQQRVALISDQPGRLSIPDLRLTWWDTQTNQPNTVVLPGRTFTVEPGPGGGAPVSDANLNSRTSPAAASTWDDPAARPETSSQHIGTSYWLWISLGFAALWIGTCIAWWRSHRGRLLNQTTRPNEQGVVIDTSEAKAAFHRSCRANEAVAARRNLLLWANATWPSVHIRGLNALADRIGDENLTRLLRDLDRACYTSATWTGANLSEALRNWPRVRHASGDHQDGLLPLYP